MEAFSLLKYWNTSGGPRRSSPSTAPESTTTTIVTAVRDLDSDAADDDGPFFDLEFAVPAEEGDDDEHGSNEEEEYDDDDTEEGDEDDKKEETETEIISNELEEEDEEVEERELEPNLTYSPSDDLFFKGRIVRIDGSEEIIHSGNKSGQFPIPVSLAKSATKFRVFLLGLKRSKSESKQSPPPQNQPNNHQNIHNVTTSNKKFFTVKFKVEEVPIISLLTRASSNSNVNSNSTPTTNINEGEGQQQQKQEKGEEKENCDRSKLENSEENEKKNKKEVVQKYLKMVKPLYIKVSKKNTRNQKGTAEKKEKMVGLSQKQGGSGGLNLKVIAKKHLGKSKSAVVHSMVQNTTNTTSLSSSSSNKRDDSLLQQQDGIQSAILHCKRSFNSSKDFLDGEEASSVLLTQLVGESLNEN